MKSQFGTHIIKVIDKKAATADAGGVRPQIADQLSCGARETQAADLAQTLAKDITKPGDLDKVAKAKGLAVQESGFVAREEPVIGLGSSPEVAAHMFDMKPDEVAGPIRTSRGFAFFTLVGKQDPYVPKLEEAKDRVRDEVIKMKARAMSTQKAAEIAAAQDGAGLRKAAKAAGVGPRHRAARARCTAARPGRRTGGDGRRVRAASRRRPSKPERPTTRAAVVSCRKQTRARRMGAGRRASPINC